MKEHVRLHVVDALRGFAIVSIMLLHNIEHFDYYYSPAGIPGWMNSLGTGIWDTMFFLFGGKSYAIFAFLFGLTFFIQSDNQARKGKDFRLRFAWRLVLLFIFGIINSAFYQGDILSIYALLGFALIPVARLRTPWVATIAVILMLQPYEIYNVVNGILHPHMAVSDPASWAFFGKMSDYIPKDSFWGTIYGNLTNGKVAVYLWSWENGRVFQTIGLFMFGMIAGRNALFEDTTFSKKFWSRAFIISSVAFIPLFYAKGHLNHWILSKAVSQPVDTIITSWSNLSFMVMLVSGFIVLYRTKIYHKTLDIFSSYGKMSLTNYIMQSIIGSCIYYSFGLGLYKYSGVVYSFLIGLALAILQGIFSSWWMKNHKQGPLEWIWHKLTWLGNK